MDSAAGRLTDQQHTAIHHRGDSIALSAGAGCGKTFVLTERFLAHLEEGVTLSRLAAITFTERAAREMRDRIRARCQARRAVAVDEVERRRWLETERELHAARIHTIHAFCAALLRSHAVEAALDPAFVVLDDAQRQTLLAEAMDDELRRQLGLASPDVLDLVAEFDFPRLRKLLLELLSQRERIDFASWRDRSVDELLLGWQRHFEQVAVPQLIAGIAEHEDVRRLQAVLNENVPTNDKMRTRRLGVLAALSALPAATDPLPVLDELNLHARVEHGGGARPWVSEEVYEQVKEGANAVRAAIKSARKGLSFDVAAARPAAELGLKMLRLAESVAARFAQRKRELAALDFDDLLIEARRLLVGSEEQPPGSLSASPVARRLSERLHTLLLDEFQDTDPLQVELVKALCGAGLRTGKLFFVGDYKQSIYRFRRADPRVFEALQREVPERGRIPLSRNFRSQPQVLAFVNALFHEALGEAYQPLVPHRRQTNTGACVEFLWAVAEEQSGDKRAKEERRREADWIARRIRRMLDEGEPLAVEEEAGTPVPRAVKQGDVAILFRALSDVQHYEEALRRYDVDYYLVGGHAFYAQQEIYDVLNLLRCLSDGSDEVALAGALRSPFFNLSDETLFWLVHERGGLSRGLFAADPPVALDAEQRRRVQFAASVLRRLRGEKDRLPIAGLLREALSCTGYDALLTAEFLGERKLANLRKLIDQARSFDESGLFSLDDFITQLSEFVANAPREPLAAAHAEDADVVRLMTIHQAKGLEFPVVFVPDLARPRNNSYLGAVYHEELGPLVKAGDADAATPLNWIHREEALEDEAEHLRLFYVATTRAADYLVLSSAVQQLGQANTPWLRLLADRFDLETGALKQHLPTDWETPRVSVVTLPPAAEERGGGPRRRGLLEAVQKARALSDSDALVPPRGVPPVDVDGGARREFSFSRLSGALKLVRAIDEEPDAEPAWRMPSDVDPIGLGTLVHAVLEEIELSPAAQRQVEPLVRRLAELHLPRRADDVQSAVEMVERLLHSQRAAQIAAARVVYRELEFVLAWPPGGDASGSANGSKYLRGFIDCLYQDAAGEWHILDYKTNDVPPGDVASEARRYENQLLIYALAVQEVLGRSPVEIALHFLRPGVEHVLDFSPQAAAAAVADVNQAIAVYVQPR